MKHLEILSKYSNAEVITPRKVIQGRRKKLHYYLYDLVKFNEVIDKDGNLISYDPIITIPVDMCASDKGRLGEIVGRDILALEFGLLGEFTEPGSEYDMDLLAYTIDFKLSPLKENRKGSLGWRFYLNSGKIDPKTGKYVKHKKDYTKRCSNLVLLGVNEDGRLSIFIIPTDAPELKGQDNIKISQNRKSKWAKYEFDWQQHGQGKGINDLIQVFERPDVLRNVDNESTKVIRVKRGVKEKAAS